MDQYEKLEKIGEGTYGKVRMAAGQQWDCIAGQCRAHKQLSAQLWQLTMAPCAAAGLQGQGYQHRQAGCTQEDAAGGLSF